MVDLLRMEQMLVLILAAVGKIDDLKMKDLKMKIDLVALCIFEIFAHGWLVQRTKEALAF